MNVNVETSEEKKTEETMKKELKYAMHCKETKKTATKQTTMKKITDDDHDLMFTK